MQRLTVFGQLRSDGAVGLDVVLQLRDLGGERLLHGGQGRQRLLLGAAADVGRVLLQRVHLGLKLGDGLHRVGVLGFSSGGPGQGHVQDGRRLRCGRVTGGAVGRHCHLFGCHGHLARLDEGRTALNEVHDGRGHDGRVRFREFALADLVEALVHPGARQRLGVFQCLLASGRARAAVKASAVLHRLGQQLDDFLLHRG